MVYHHQPSFGADPAPKRFNAIGLRGSVFGYARALFPTRNAAYGSPLAYEA